MSKRRIPREEQLRLVYECRNSGLSDNQWCKQHGIPSSTFSNWVCRNKLRGEIIPDPISAEEYWPAAKPDIVQVNLVPDSKNHEHDIAIPTTREISHSVAPSALPESAAAIFPPCTPVLEMELGGARLRITNDIDPALLAQAVQILRGAAC